MSHPALTDELPAQRGGAKALLLTVLGEFALPAGGEVWTSSLVAIADVLGVSEKNARQAIARIGDQGLIAATKHGRRVRWGLTSDGRQLLESGTQRIYGFGASPIRWSGDWLVAHCPVTEAHRALRDELRKDLGFLGFGELSASLFISPHLGREPQLRDVLDQLDLLNDAVIMHSTTPDADADVDLACRAWNLDDLANSYALFTAAYEHRSATTTGDGVRAVIELVHDWRRFPFIDPELPTELLPQHWAGTAAAELFQRLHHDWSPSAQRWFSELESAP